MEKITNDETITMTIEDLKLMFAYLNYDCECLFYGRKTVPECYLDAQYDVDNRLSYIKEFKDLLQQYNKKEGAE